MDKYQEVRELFVNYFTKFDHKQIKSSNLVPDNDPSLLFTNSGMVQFKNVFLGLENRDYKTATTIQKSLRAGGKHNDLDNVGYTARHHTFFEMLGNFSFGDYFKHQAIEYAWNFLTKEINLNKDKLYITVYHTDDEAFEIWKKLTGFSDDKIIKISTNDNFWSMGDTGPCGPCSEIYYDYGDSIAGGLPGSEEQDGDRYVEIWNLVFMQYNQIMVDSEKKLEPLKKQCIDTGMGLERLISIMENKTDNYDTSFFTKLIQNSKDTLSDNNPKNEIAHRVIADHLRSTAFLIAEGILPSNEGRGYVLRRIMRRAMRYLYQINPSKIAMHELVNMLEFLMSKQYPELTQHLKLIQYTINTEEIGFRDTLSRGMKILDNHLITELNGSKILAGDMAFKLYDTYGFPMDMTRDIVRKDGIIIDEKRFNELMEKQKKLSKLNWSGSGDNKDDEIWLKLNSEDIQTQFIGYDNLQCKSQILAIIKNGDRILNINAKKGDEFYIITDQTVFYPLGGGQLGDIGYMSINSDNLNEIKVIDTVKYQDIIAHRISIISDVVLNINSQIFLSVDENIRLKRSANHSATHLLNSALRLILGKHVTQKGSLVSESRIRFDFSHNKALNRNELNSIEELVNSLIRLAIPLNTNEMRKDDAERSGAIANFGDKYSDNVRIVSFGDKSMEFCGGTHVKNTGNIGVFKIISETSISSGTRRIEAITGESVVNYCSIISDEILKIGSLLKINQNLENINKDNKIFKKIEDLILENDELQNTLNDIKIKELLSINLDTINLQDGRSAHLIKLTKIENKNIKNVMFGFIDKYSNNVIIGLFQNDNSNTKSIAVISDLSDYNAKEILHQITEKCDGSKSGGGTEKFAMSNIINIQNLNVF